ncbi:MAG: MerR family transcriptional regulator [Clostridia bacterium]|nr:MerR family transcriptional regulator [Clostridia bacterium]
MEKLYDISEVCELLGTTSRTLRFYEEKGIIQSTKELDSQRRKYTESQLEHIKCVLVLRSIGISLKEIEGIIHDESSLEETVRIKKAERFALIEKCRKEIILLDEAIKILNSGGDIYSIDSKKVFLSPEGKRAEIVEKCTSAILEGNMSEAAEHFSKAMREKDNLDGIVETFRSISEPLGRFIVPERIVEEKGHENVLLHHLRFEKLGIVVRYVFRGELIHGLWLDYYGLED